MNRRAGAVALAVFVVGAALLAVQTGLVADETERDTVVVESADGERLAAVEARIADTDAERYRGLSDTESLDRNEGMLFVHPEVGVQRYVMRDMAFPLDIIFVAADGTVTEIHHAPVPPEGTNGDDLTRYRGEGKYVLEVRRGFANRTGLAVGDRVIVPEQYRDDE